MRFGALHQPDKIQYYVNTPIHHMSRLTITLSKTRYQALKEAAARRDKSMTQLIDESLEFYGIKTREEARDMVLRARKHSGLDEAAALALAEREVRAHRT